MKNIIYCFIIFTIIILVRQGFIKPAGSSNIKFYTYRKNTKIVLNIPDINTSVELPRFPTDVIVYAPIKLIRFIDINVMEKENFPIKHKSYLKDSIPEKYSFAYCYMRMLEEYDVSFPIVFKSKDINYDLRKYVSDEEDTFKLSDISIDNISKEDIKILFTAMNTQAKRDTIKVELPFDNCIVEVSNGEKVRYLWGYHYLDDYLYVVDPYAPQLSYARINFTTKEYKTSTGVFKVNSIFRKLKVTVSAEKEAVK